MTSYRIRPFDPREACEVTAILAGSEPWTTLGYAPEAWERHFAALPPEREALVLELDARVAAIAVLRPGFLYGDYLELLAVAGPHRGCGLGTTLLARVEAAAFARGTNLFACVSDFNRAARRFYAARGYREVGLLQGLIIPGHDEILLRKSTGPTRQLKSPRGESVAPGAETDCA